MEITKNSILIVLTTRLVSSRALCMHCYLFNITHIEKINRIQGDERFKEDEQWEVGQISETVFCAFPETGEETGDRGMVHIDLRHLSLALGKVCMSAR